MPDALCGIASSVALAILLSRAAILDFIRVMGVCSLEIYVAHTIASAGLRVILLKILKVQDPTIHIVIGTIGGIVLPLLLTWFSRRFHANFLFRIDPRRQA